MKTVGGKPAHVNVVLGLIGLCGIMGSIPYLSRVSQPSLSSKEKLTGSQRQRGMNLMGGTQDAGVDPNYDHSTGTYNAHKPHPLNKNKNNDGRELK